MQHWLVTVQHRFPTPQTGTGSQTLQSLWYRQQAQKRSPHWIHQYRLKAAHFQLFSLCTLLLMCQPFHRVDWHFCALHGWFWRGRPRSGLHRTHTKRTTRKFVEVFPQLTAYTHCLTTESNTTLWFHHNHRWWVPILLEWKGLGVVWQKGLLLLLSPVQVLVLLVFWDQRYPRGVHGKNKSRPQLMRQVGVAASQSIG